MVDIDVKSICKTRTKHVQANLESCPFLVVMKFTLSIRRWEGFFALFSILERLYPALRTFGIATERKDNEKPQNDGLVFFKIHPQTFDFPFPHVAIRTSKGHPRQYCFVVTSVRLSTMLASTD